MADKVAVWEQALALPAADRVELAQALWDSLEDGEWNALRAEDSEIIAIARQRADELASGAVLGVPHEDVMEAMRRTIQCESNTTSEHKTN